MDNWQKHGKYIGLYLACEICAEISLSTKFKNEIELEEHIKSIHIKRKTHKITLDKRIFFLVTKLKQYDKAFNALIDNDSNESEDRIKFFIRDEKYLDMIYDKNFKLLLNQIGDFYGTSDESLVDWNYRMNVYEDYVNEETTAKIMKDKKVDP